MDDTSQAAPAPTPKQQLSDTIKNASSLVITTNKNPGVDQIAAAIALQQILQKMDKSVELVINAPIPQKLNFLPIKSIRDHLQGNRDFIIQLDITKTEADKLKYVPENGKLKVYITPYNGNFKEEDVSFAYGDFHCDGIIGFGVERLEDLDDSIRKEPKFTDNTPLLTINAGPSSIPEDSKSISWHDPTASAACEMVMSLTEALQSGLLDQDIATALLTGIVEQTKHFTSPATTPKVMTMAAQLLAAGARQAEIVQNLNQPDRPVQKTKAQHPPASTDAGNQVQLRQPQNAPNAPAPRQDAPQSQPNVPIAPIPDATLDRVETLSSMPDPLAPPTASPLPPQPGLDAQHHERVVQPPNNPFKALDTKTLLDNLGGGTPMNPAPVATPAPMQPLNPPAASAQPPAAASPASGGNNNVDLEAARRAVETAMQGINPNPEDAANNFQNPPPPPV